MKRVFSLFLALVMLVGMVPVPAKASQTNPSVDANDMTVEGTDSFGSLLSEELNGESILADTYIDGYAITGLTFDGNTAAVTYGSLGPARLVVSIYTEDGLTMLSTANTNVSEGEGEVTLTMPGEMPEYFYAAAFLLNADDLTPLCDSYDTPMYTREMQELLESTIHDYDAELVMNLDTREDTNFLVFEEDTIRAESSAAVNTVISADDEKLLYVIGNADETVKNLQKGDVFSCSYGNNNLLIVKVDTLTVEGDIVTIHGTDLEMEEVFSHVKIEYEGGAADVEVDDSGCYEGIIYAGKEDSGSTYAARHSTYVEGGAEDTLELKFILDEVKIGEAKMEGSLKITPTAKFNYYAASDRKYVDLSISLKVTLGVTFKGKVPLKNVPLGYWGISPVPGVYIGFEPAFVVEFEASLSFGLTFFTETGITYEVGKAPKRHNVKPTVDIDIQVEGKLFVGIDLDPTVEVVGGKIIDLTLEMGFGFELTGKMGGQLYDGIQIAGQKNQEEQRHTCNHCLGVDVVFKAEMSFKIEFLKLKALTKEFKLAVLKIDLGSFYYSFTFGEFGWGGCPHLSYRVIVQVKDVDGEPVENIPVCDDKGKELGKTDEKGQVIVYRVEGEYTFSATVNGTKLQKTKNVTRASRVLLSEGVGTGLSAIFGALEEEDVTNYGEVVMDGECGDFTTWVLYENGTLIIEGEGDITVTSGYWSEYQDDIETIVIREGVTSISDNLFSGYTNLTTLLIADTVTTWGSRAFSGCTGLKYVSVPVDYAVFNLERGDSVGIGVFYGCNNVEYIRYTPGTTGKMIPRDKHGNVYTVERYYQTMEYGSRETLKTVEFAEGVTSIGSYAFYTCSALENLSLPSTLESMGGYTFYGCTSLSEIEIPESVSGISQYVFYGCTGLTELVIPDTVTSISNNAFEGCTGLTRLEIADSVTEWGRKAFSGCTGLKYVSVPVDYAVFNLERGDSVDIGVFYGCNNVEYIRYTPGTTGKMIPRDKHGHVYTVERYYQTMEYGSREVLKTIEVMPGVVSLGAAAFTGVTANVYYDDESGVWTEDKRTGYGGTLTWLPLSALEETPEEEIPEETTEPVEETYEEVTEPVEEIPEVMEIPETTEVTVPVTEGSSSSASDPSGVGRELYSIFGGDYGTEETETQTLTVASFSGLVAGEEYVLLVVRNLKAADMLDGSNLIYIAQNSANSDGTLTFRYAKREDVKQSYVMVVGPSGKDLKDAVITFPTMEADGELHTVNPTVVYEGKTLTEGKDYNILGAGSYVKPGEYVCYIQGIHDYSGLVTCVYTVEGGIPGDVDLNGNVDVDDVLALLWYVLFPDDYPIDAEADFDKSGSVDVDDVLTLLWYVLFPDEYPL